MLLRTSRSLSTAAASPLQSEAGASTTQSTTTHFKITLRRSAIFLGEKKQGTLKSLGLHRRMQTVYHRHSPEVAGKILHVKELLEVENIPQELVQTKQEQRQERKAERGYKVVGEKRSTCRYGPPSGRSEAVFFSLLVIVLHFMNLCTRIFKVLYAHLQNGARLARVTKASQGGSKPRQLPSAWNPRDPCEALDSHKPCFAPQCIAKPWASLTSWPQGLHPGMHSQAWGQPYKLVLRLTTKPDIIR